MVREVADTCVVFLQFKNGPKPMFRKAQEINVELSND